MGRTPFDEKRATEKPASDAEQTRSSGPLDPTRPLPPGTTPGAPGTWISGSGQRLGPYELIEKLGEGGMGSVWKAKHTKLDKLVALKLLPPHLTSDRSSVSRFEREMKAVGKLEHPHIVRAMDADESNGVHYLVMEYVEGMDLGRLVAKRGPRSVPEACQLIRHAALGLAHAHEHGLVHRDIKPSNLLLSLKGRVKILDLGLARLQVEKTVEGDALTVQGEIMGTPDFMAPEQWHGAHTAGPAADIYALGCTLFYLLVGHAPFAGQGRSTFAQKMKAHILEAPPRLKELLPKIPAELDLLCTQMLAKEIADRPSSAKLADEIRDMLKNWAKVPGAAEAIDKPVTEVVERPSVTNLGTQALIANLGALRARQYGIALGLLFIFAMAIVAVVLIPRGPRQPTAEDYRDWEFSYQKQRDVLAWPKGLSQELVAAASKLVPIEAIPLQANGQVDANYELPRDYRTEIQNFLEIEIPELATKIGATWRAAFANDSDNQVQTATSNPDSLILDQSIVFWEPDNQSELLIKSFGFLGRSSIPSTLEVLYAMEDFWVLHDITDIIRETNKGAEKIDDAPIKRVDYIRIGRSAADAMQGKPAPKQEGNTLLRDPAEGRYVDHNSHPISALRLRQIASGRSAEVVRLVVAKRIPVLIRLSVDEKKLDTLRKNCGRAILPLELTRVRTDLPPAGAHGKIGVYPNMTDVELEGIVQIYNPPRSSTAAIPKLVWTIPSKVSSIPPQPASKRRDPTIFPPTEPEVRLAALSEGEGVSVNPEPKYVVAVTAIVPFAKQVAEFENALSRDFDPQRDSAWYLDARLERAEADSGAADPASFNWQRLKLQFDDSSLGEAAAEVVPAQYVFDGGYGPNLLTRSLRKNQKGSWDWGLHSSVFGVRNSSATFDSTYNASPPPSFKVLRVFDGFPNRNKSYCYRVQVRLHDPNHPMPSLPQPSLVSLNEDVQKRVKEIDAADAFKPKGSDGLPYRTFWIVSPWSEPTKPIAIP